MKERIWDVMRVRDLENASRLFHQKAENAWDIAGIPEQDDVNLQFQLDIEVT